MSKNFYIADTHFAHTNILHFDNRPWSNIEEHDTALIEKWNSVVTSQDTVYILGDFHWGKECDWIEVLENLNGNKVLIRGNHDIIPQKSKKYFQDIKDYKEIDDNGRKVVLCHYPMPYFKNHFYGWFHLYGHVHNSFEHNMAIHQRYLMEELYSRQCEMYNVGAMMPWIGFTPRTLDEITEGYTQYKMIKKEIYN